MAAKKLFTQIFIYFSKPLRLLYSLIIYEIVNFSFFALYSLLLLSFFLYLKSVPIYVIVHVYTYLRVSGTHSSFQFVGCQELEILHPDSAPLVLRTEVERHVCPAGGVRDRHSPHQGAERVNAITTHTSGC